MSVDPQVEPSFVGTSRLRLVEGLRDCFDAVNTGTGPRWIALEAPSGWGKTRVVREFYATLAASRQAEPPYWPPSVLRASATEPGTVGERRKRIHPDLVDRAAGSLPDWFWWGITCTSRHGSPSVALAQDLRQLAAHGSFLEDRWRTLASLRERYRGAGGRVAREVGNEAASEVTGQAVEAVVGAAVPGVGLAIMLGRWGVGEALAARERFRRMAEPVTIDTSDAGPDLVEDAAATIGRLARPGLPVVIAVEDLHRADATLRELLGLLMRSAAAVLLVTTSWPGLIDTDADLSELVAGVPAERVIRVGHDRATPSELPARAGLGPLTPADLAAIARFHLPQATPETVDLLVERYPNPLPLELACAVHRSRRRSRGVATTLSPQDVARLPATVEDLYREIWRELPQPVQEGLVLAAWGVPASIGSTTYATADDRWDPGLLAEVVAALYPDATDLVEALDGAPTAYAWAREVDAVFRRFHEPVQLEIAAADPGDLFYADDRRAFYAALAERLAEDAGDIPHDVRLHRAEVMLALWTEGFVAATPAVLSAATRVGLHLASFARELPRAVDLLDSVRAAASDDAESVEERVWLDTVRGTILMDLGRGEEAVEAMRGAVTVAESRWGDDERTFVLRRRVADALRVAGRAGEAVRAFHALLPNLERFHGGNRVAMFSFRNNLAAALSEAGQPAQALQQLSEVATGFAEMYGEDDERTLTVRANLAAALAATGRVAEAIELVRALADARTRTLGEHHPGTLEARNVLGSYYGQLGRTDEALAVLGPALQATTDALGPHHPMTLRCQGNLATVMSDTGRTDEAETLLRAAIAAQTRVLGDRDPLTMLARNNLAHLLGRTGRLDEAIAAFEPLVADYLRRYGPDHLGTLRARANLAETLVEAGRPEGEAMMREVCADRTRVAGPDYPDTLSSRRGLAYLRANQGRHAEAAADLEPLIRDWERIFGPDNPELKPLRAALAHALAELGRPEAIPVLERVAEDWTALHGPDDLRAIDTRLTLAWALTAHGRPAEAVPVAADVAERGERLLGVDAPGTQQARLAWAYAARAAQLAESAVTAFEGWLASATRTQGPGDRTVLVIRSQAAAAKAAAGRLDEAVDDFRRLAADAPRHLGADDADALTARYLYGQILLRTGQAEEAVDVLLPLAADQDPVHGPGAEPALVTRELLAEALQAAGRHAEAMERDGAVILGLTRSVGPDDIRTLAARYRHCRNVELVDGPAAALALAEALLNDLERVAPQEEEAIGNLRAMVASGHRRATDGPGSP